MNNKRKRKKINYKYKDTVNADIRLIINMTLFFALIFRMRDIEGSSEIQRLEKTICYQNLSYKNINLRSLSLGFDSIPRFNAEFYLLN